LSVIFLDIILNFGCLTGIFACVIMQISAYLYVVEQIEKTQDSNLENEEQLMLSAEAPQPIPESLRADNMIAFLISS